MKRIIGLLSAGLLATSLAVLAPSSPASADVCVGTGTASFASPGLRFPIVGEHNVLGFSLTVSTGACTGGTALAVTGTAQGYCGHSTGSGTDNTGHTIQWTSAGGLIVFSGEVVGVGRVDPNIFAGESCLAGSLSFLVTFVVMRQNCTTKTLTNSLTSLVNDGPVGGDLSTHTSFHFCIGTQL